MKYPKAVEHYQAVQVAIKVLTGSEPYHDVDVGWLMPETARPVPELIDGLVYELIDWLDNHFPEGAP